MMTTNEPKTYGVGPSDDEMDARRTADTLRRMSNDIPVTNEERDFAIARSEEMARKYEQQDPNPCDHAAQLGYGF
jgi:hypothetical protein